MGVPPAKLHEKPVKANKWGTRSEHAAGFFDPVAGRRAVPGRRGQSGGCSPETRGKSLILRDITSTVDAAASIVAYIDSEALVGQVGNLRPIGNRPVFRFLSGAYTLFVQGFRPKNAPEGIVFHSCERPWRPNFAAHPRPQHSSIGP